jgi:hypothetical protein
MINWNCIFLWWCHSNHRMHRCRHRLMRRRRESTTTAIPNIQVMQQMRMQQFQQATRTLLSISILHLDVWKLNCVYLLTFKLLSSQECYWGGISQFTFWQKRQIWCIVRDCCVNREVIDILHLYLYPTHYNLFWILQKVEKFQLTKLLTEKTLILHRRFHAAQRTSQKHFTLAFWSSKYCRF